MFPVSGSVLPARITPAHLRPLAYRTLSKKHGLSIKSDGLVALAEIIGSRFGTEWKRNPLTLKFLEQLALVWKQQERGLFVDRQGVLEVMDELVERDHYAHSTQAVEIASQQRSARSTHGDEPSPPDIDLENPAQIQQHVEINWKDYFKVVNAREQQRFTYNPIKRHFMFLAPNSTSSSSKLSIPDAHFKKTMFSTRYYLTRDRIMRNENFQNNDTFNPLSSMILMKNDLMENSLDTSSPATYMSITPIKNLLGRDGQNFLLLGLLCHNTKGHLSLEDPSGSIEIDISQTQPTKGLYYVPGCMVLVEGIYFTVGNRFHVTSMTHPPGERRDVTMDALGNLDLLGVHIKSSTNQLGRIDNDTKLRLHFLEKELNDNYFIILGGDIFLDQLETFEALTKIFDKLNEQCEADPQNTPITIIFYGSFSSVPVFASMSSKSISSSQQYKNNFDTLAKLLSKYDQILNHCTLVFVPGVNDPWGSINALGATNCLPINPIPSSFTNRINRVCKKVIWASNPSRLAYLSQEIVLMRDNLADRFKRHSIIFPMVEETKQQALDELQQELQDVSIEDPDNSVMINQLIRDKDQLPTEVEQSRKYIKTILDQSHLSPFTDNITPVVWNLDHTLTLYPIPSTLIICDPTAPRFDITYNGCKTINPGRFILNRRARYLMYQPSTKRSIEEEVYF